VPDDTWGFNSMLLTGFTWPAGASTLRLTVAPTGSCGAGLPDTFWIDDIVLQPGIPSIGIPDAPCPSSGTTTTTSTTTSTSTTSTTTTTSATAPAPYCLVHYMVSSQWQQGFVADIAVTNTGTSAWTSWTLRWRYPGGQQITTAWNGTWTMSGQSVTFTGSAWQLPVQVGQTVHVGFNGTGNGSSPPPADFSVNGHPCGIS
jgi:hypothetical protein